MKRISPILFFGLVITLLFAVYTLVTKESAEQDGAIAGAEYLSGSLASSGGTVPQSADSFVDSIGVVTHLFYDSYMNNGVVSDVYSSIIQPRMRELGVRIIRDDMTTTGTGQKEFKAVTERMAGLRTDTGFPVRVLLQQRYFKEGQEITSLHPTHPCYIPKLEAMIQGTTVPCGPQIGQSLPQVPVEAIEMPNEIDHCASFLADCQAAADDPGIPGTWFEKSVARYGDWPVWINTASQQIHDALKSSPVTTNLPLIAPSYVHSVNFASIPYGGTDLKSYLQQKNGLYSASNAHVYCTTRPLSWCVDNAQSGLYKLNDMLNLFPGKSIWTTETGTSPHDGNQVVIHNDSQIAKMTIRSLFDFWDKGSKRTFIYELLDEPLAATAREQTFGLVRPNGEPKPSFTALKNLIDLLEEAPGVTIDPRPLSYSVSPSVVAGAGVRTTLFRKTNGKYYLVVRNETPTITLQDQSINTSVTINDSLESVKVYRPSTGAAPLQTFTSGTFSLSVPDDVLVLEITLATVSNAGGGGSGAVGGETGGGAGASGGATTGGSGSVSSGTKKSGTSSSAPGGTSEQPASEGVAEVPVVIEDPSVEASPLPVSGPVVVSQGLVKDTSTFLQTLWNKLSWLTGTEERRQRTLAVGYGLGALLMLFLVGRALIVHRLYAEHTRTLS